MAEIEVSKTMVNVLRFLLACERGLVRAYAEGGHGHPLQGAEGALVPRGSLLHQRHAQWLAEQLRAHGGSPPDFIDNLWVRDDLRFPFTLLEAERLSHDTWQDVLTTLSPELASSIMEHLLRDHHDLLTHWQELLGEETERAVSV